MYAIYVSKYKLESYLGNISIFLLFLDYSLDFTSYFFIYFNRFI